LEFVLKKFFKSTYWMFIIAAIIIILDQLTKWLVRSNLVFGDSWIPFQSLPFLRIVYWKNTGVAFGMLQGMNIVFIFLAALVAVALVWYYPSIPREDWLIRLALSLELGGALGNLVDRIRFGHVIDFVSVGNFPVFNVADSCITVGIFVLLLGIWIQEQREKKKIADPAVTSDGEPQ